MIELGTWLGEQGQQMGGPASRGCCHFVADWAVRRGYPDPMTGWRDRMDLPEMAEQLDIHGGLLVLLDEAFEGSGIERRAGDRQPGDIGLIVFGHLETCGIWTGQRWAMAADHGIALATVDPANVAAIWAVGHG